MQLTDKESTVFWPLYDNYEKKEISIFNKRAAHFREYLQEPKNLSDKKAKSMMNDFLEIEAEALRTKRALVKNSAKNYLPKEYSSFLCWRNYLKHVSFIRLLKIFLK